MGNQQSIENAAERRLKRMENAKRMDRSKESTLVESTLENATFNSKRDSDGPCMKDKIDNLIEGYLLNTECSDSEMDDLPTSLIEKFKISKSKGNSTEDKNGDSFITNKQEDDILTQCKKRIESEGTTEGNKSSSVNFIAQSKEVQNSSTSETKKEKVDSPKNAEKEKSVVTFQNMIDKVLSSSVNRSCDKSQEERNEVDTPKGPAEKVVMETEVDNSAESGNQQCEEEKTKNNSNKEDMSLSKSKVMYLKDHIEKILDNSFKPVSNKPKSEIMKKPEISPIIRETSKTKKCMTLEEHMKSIVYNELLKDKLSEEQNKELKDGPTDKSVPRRATDDDAMCQYESLSTKVASGTFNSKVNTGNEGSVPENSDNKSVNVSSHSEAKSNETLKKSSVEAIMDNIIMNAVNEQYIDQDKKREELRRNIRDVIYSESEPGPPRLEKYDVHDSICAPKLLRADEHFAESHKQLLEQTKGKRQMQMSPNSSNFGKEFAHGNIPSGLRPPMETTSHAHKGSYPMFNDQGVPLVSPPRQYRQVSPNDSETMHYIRQQAGNHTHSSNHKQAISLRDCQCVSCEKKLSSHAQCGNAHLPPHPSVHGKQRSPLSPHIGQPYYPPNSMSHHTAPGQGHDRYSGSKTIDPDVSMTIPPGHGPNHPYNPQNAFRMPHMYPSNAPIPSHKETAGIRTGRPFPPQSGNYPQHPVSANPPHSDRINPMQHGAKLSPSIGPRNPGPSVSHPFIPVNPHEGIDQTRGFKSKAESQPPRPPFGSKHPSPPVLDLTLKRPYVETSSPSSKSGDQPLDLSVKKPKASERMGNSVAYPQGPPHNEKRGAEPVTHIHHLQNSMDRFCYEAKTSSYTNFQQYPRPPVRQSGMLGMKSHAGPRPDVPYSNAFPSTGQRLHAPHPGGTPSDTYPGLHHSSRGHHSLNTSTSGNHMDSSGRNSVPHVNNSHHVVQQQPIKSQHLAQHLPQNVRQSPKQPSVPGETRMPGEQDRNFGRHDSPEMTDSNGQRSRRSNSVSKHEPIQNIIGNHSPNDILYLICRLCGQTYGSPYGFRKHFRNQHGFEPHAEHTVVQTISATKTAMRGPPLIPQGDVSMNPHMMQFPHGPQQFPAAEEQKQLLMPPLRQIPRAKSASPKSLKNMERLTFVKTHEKTDRVDQKSEGLNEESLSREDNSDIHNKEMSGGDSNYVIPKQDENVTERRYLECHECGQHFQLNDFGSYKRHCRQHGHRLENPFKAASDAGASVVPTGQTLTSNPEEKSSSAYRSVHSVGQKEFRCKFCKELFLAPDLLEEHINSSHPDKQCRFKCLICRFRSHLFYSFKSHMSKIHKLSVPDSNNFSCPDLKFAQEMSSEEKSFPTEKESKTASSGNVDLKFIPSSEVTRMSADTAVTSASPDSSCDPVASGSSKTESLSSTSKVTTQINDQCSESKDSSIVAEKSTSISRQMSQESGSFSDNSQTADDNSEFSYMHKKFGSKRKMSVNNSQNSNDSTKSKVLKTSLSVDSSTKSPGISQRSPSVNSNASVESESSSVNESRLVVDTKESKLSPLTGSDDGSGKYMMKMRYNEMDENDQMFLQKGEARHQLPFVWDRVTRTKAGKNIKPPKYHS